MKVLIDLDALQQAALAATQGRESWRTNSRKHGIPNPHVVDFGVPPSAPYAVCYGDDMSGPANAAFIAAANPAAVLELVRRLRTAEDGLTACQAQRVQTESATIPAGWTTKTVLVRPSGAADITNEMKATCIGHFQWINERTCDACCFGNDDPECEVCGGDGHYTETITVPWDICKDIYKAMLAAAPDTAPQPQRELTGCTADARTLIAFIFNRFCLPEDAGDLPDEVVAAVRRLEAALAVPA